MAEMELLSMRPRLRDDLNVVAQWVKGRVVFRIEDPNDDRFFQIGAKEAAFISLLDGRRTLDQARSALAGSDPGRAVRREQAEGIGRWLVKNRLATFGEERLLHRQQPGAAAHAAERAVSPFWIPVSLGDIDPLVDRLHSVCGWSQSRGGIAASLLTIAAGIFCLAGSADALRSAARGILAPGNWIVLGLVFLLLKCVHEAAHALACRHYGCRVRDWGIVLVCGVPCPFVDVTSSWRLASRWQRIHIAAAGMLAECTLAAVAAMFWSVCEDAAVRHWLYCTMVAASVGTILFNANPLMRFDGYYIMTDFCDRPNLYAEGQRRWLGVLAQWLGGRRWATPDCRGCRAPLVTIYGFAAFVWRVVVYVSLLAAAAHLFYGFGLIAVAGILCLLGGRAAVRGIKRIEALREPAGAVTARPVFLGVAGIGLCAAMAWMPMPTRLAAPGIVEFEGNSAVRSEVAGIVAEVFVPHGRRVTAGEPILRLRNEELRYQLEAAVTELEQSQLRRSLYLGEDQTAAAQAEAEDLEALRERVEELQRQVSGLVVRAPREGQLVARGIERSIGRFVRPGDALGAVGHADAKELTVSVDERDLRRVPLELGQPLPVRVGTQHGVGQLQGMHSRATREPAHVALLAPAGGPIPVERDDDEAGDASAYQYVHPRVQATVRLPSELSGSVLCGQIGVVRLGASQQAVAGAAWDALSRWIDHLFREGG